MNLRFLMACAWLVALPAPFLFGQSPPSGATAVEREVQKAGAKRKESNYLRVLRNDRDQPISMQTSVVSFRYADGARQGVVVDLIGAVHVADKPYFTELNRRFKTYDALLYELVAPKEHDVSSKGKSAHPVGQMQHGLKSMLELSFQLEEINYKAKNFVHADMSPTEFGKVMSDRGESFLTMFARMMGSAMALQAGRGGNTDAELLIALLSGKDRALKLKRVMSTQFQDLDGTMAAIEGPQGSTLIGQRNRKALDVLEQELAAGKKRIGIFYGAGHMPDMEKRMKERFGLVPDFQKAQWITAWDMSGKKK